MKQRLSILTVIFSILLFGIGYNDHSEKSNARTCTDHSIPYSTSTIDDASLEIGTDTVTTSGVNGEKRICVNGYDTTISDTVVREPIKEVMSHGTRQPVQEPLYMQPQGGSICNDGSYSPSVGSGACSHHDGVDYYL